MKNKKKLVLAILLIGVFASNYLAVSLFRTDLSLNSYVVPMVLSLIIGFILGILILKPVEINIGKQKTVIEDFPVRKHTFTILAILTPWLSYIAVINKFLLVILTILFIVILFLLYLYLADRQKNPLSLDYWDDYENIFVNAIHPFWVMVIISLEQLLSSWYEIPYLNTPYPAICVSIGVFTGFSFEYLKSEFLEWNRMNTQIQP